MGRRDWFVGNTLVRSKIGNNRASSKLMTIANQNEVKYTDPEQERNPPPSPTPLHWPTPASAPLAAWDEESGPPDLQTLYAEVRKPADITERHLRVLNVEFCPPCSIDNLLPSATDGKSYLPSLVPDEHVQNLPFSKVFTADATTRRRLAFEQCLRELRVDDDTAYQVIARVFRGAGAPPKITSLREFWTALESMSVYWDASRDSYYDAPPPESEPEPRPPLKRQRTGDSPLEPADIQLPPSPSGRDDTKAEDNRRSPSTIAKSPQIDTPISRERYKGRRTSTGRQMPDSFRENVLSAFVQAAVRPFMCNIHSHARLKYQLLQVNKLWLPVRQVAMVYYVPVHRKNRHSRAGPVMVIQTHPETTTFNEMRTTMFQLREAAALLQLAQHRAREGKKENVPGHGAWWAERPRWGGGEGGAFGGLERLVPTPLQAEELDKAARVRRESVTKVVKEAEKNWRQVKGPEPYWDPKEDYMAIGKEPGSPYDEVFMVSSMNHHVSIVKMTVHEAYTAHVADGKLPAAKSPASALDWCRPRIQRTRWYDLFNSDDRIEAFQSIWGVMEYLTRCEPQTEHKASTNNDRSSDAEKTSRAAEVTKLDENVDPEDLGISKR